MMTVILACPHCGKPVQLDQSQVRVPVFDRRWWQFGDERSEFRCKGCNGFSRMRLSAFGIALYGVEVAALGWGWMQSSIPRMGLLAGGLVAAALLFRHAVKLVSS